MKTITVNANIQFDIHDKATPEAIESIITLINDTLGMCEFESQPQIMPDTVKLVEDAQEKEIRDLMERLWALREKYESDADISVNAISWIDQTLDQVEIGFFKSEPDGDYQNELADEGHSLTYEEAKTELYVRFKNFCDAAGIEVTSVLPEYKEL